MKQVCLVHCWDGSIEDGWYPWINNQLSYSNIKVKRLVMPNSHAPEINEWIEKIKEEVKKLDKDTYFIGHSIGCQAILRYLETQKVQMIGGLLLVTPWCKLLPKAIETEEDKKIAKPWLTTPIDFEKIKKFTNNITCIFSDNDYFVPISQKDFFKSKLNANCLVVNSKGHISEEDNIKYLDEILTSAGNMLGLELIEILNESGTYAGVIMDKKIAHDKNILHNEISVFVVNDKNEVLLQKRSPNKRFKPNKWGLCSGHVDAFESLEQAAIREVYEEIGLKIKEKDLHSFYGRKIFKNEQNSHISYFY